MATQDDELYGVPPEEVAKRAHVLARAMGVQPESVLLAMQSSNPEMAKMADAQYEQGGRAQNAALVSTMRGIEEQRRAKLDAVRQAQAQSNFERQLALDKQRAYFDRERIRVSDDRNALTGERDAARAEAGKLKAAKAADGKEMGEKPIALLATLDTLDKELAAMPTDNNVAAMNRWQKTLNDKMAVAVAEGRLNQMVMKNIGEALPGVSNMIPGLNKLTGTREEVRAELQRLVDHERQSVLTAQKLGGRNTSRFDAAQPTDITPTAPGPAPAAAAAPASPAAPQRKVIGGVTYERRPEGWVPVK